LELAKRLWRDMMFDQVASTFPISENQVLEVLVKLEIDEAAAGLPRLAAGAPWVRHLSTALALSKRDPATFRRVIVVITAVYLGSDDPTALPDISVSDFDDNFSDYLLSMFVDSPWDGRITSVDIREQWEPRVKFRLMVTIYGLTELDIKYPESRLGK
jgi:hypothetical protein